MREQSFMIVIPKDQSVIDDPNGFLDNLAASEHIDIKAGDTGTYPFSDITDWLIYTKDGNITPDDAYRLI